MDVRNLKVKLESVADKRKINPLLTNISHWTKRIFDSSGGKYTTRDFNEIEALEKLVELDLVSLKRGGGDNIIAELTRDGKELYMDFMKLGYYL